MSEYDKGSGDADLNELSDTVLTTHSVPSRLDQLMNMQHNPRVSSQDWTVLSDISRQLYVILVRSNFNIPLVYIDFISLVFLSFSHFCIIFYIVKHLRPYSVGCAVQILVDLMIDWCMQFCCFFFFLFHVYGHSN